ncbi:tetratricopeptide repeat protein [Sphingomonas sp. Leaf343]|uniref:tetratricopeptide repeat protein n=1 Tax=Sphingomonas sp. Leaf343 TaxID=1736345 RepID=UPI0006F7765C|nr:tetratricopeptide repeat protein [Sphingomonas sp. Leaf343]KQR83966.1 hypothetical protein ASG07_04945 [Sphingomonas sp. Leaf343]
MARIIRTCNLIALAAAFASPAAADTGRTAYLTARAAEADGDGPAASAAYAAALAASPDDPVVAIRAFRAGIASGDAALVRKTAAVLRDAGVAPADAALFPIADAARAGDAAALTRATRALSTDRLRILAPMIEAWAAGGNAGVALLDRTTIDPVARPLVAEHRALLLIAAGRASEGSAAAGLASTTSPAPRLAAAELFVGAGEPDRAQALLGTGRPLPVGRKPTPAFGMSRLFLRLAEDLGRGEQASTLSLSLARAALDADPDYARARLILANQLARAGDADAALTNLAAIPVVGPLSEEALSGEVLDARIALLGGSDRSAEALAAARTRAAATDATFVDRVRLADLLVEADSPAEAAPIYARVLDDPRIARRWNAWLRYATALDAADRWKDARRALRRAVALGPDQPLVLNYLGYGLVDRGEDIAAATRMLEKAHALEPEDPAIADSLGWAYHRAGQTARALPLLERAAQDSPADADIADHLGDVYWATGRRYEARYAWRAAALVAEPRAIGRLTAKIENGPAAR